MFVNGKGIPGIGLSILIITYNIILKSGNSLKVKSNVNLKLI